VAIDGPLGQGSLRVRTYSTAASAEEGGPALIWVHGGGWVAGSIDEPESDWVARELVVRAGLTVITRTTPSPTGPPSPTPTCTGR
jgi:acetyl esterase/lipase